MYPKPKTNQQAGGPPVMPDPAVGVNLTGNAKDRLETISGYALNNPVYNEAIGRRNEGLPDVTRTALAREATTGLQDRYESAARTLRTDLQRRGLYGGELPANETAMVEGFAPLKSELANAQSKAASDLELNDYNALLSNRNQAMQAVGASIDKSMSAAGAMGGLESASFKNIILSALAGTAGKAITDPKVLKYLTNSLGKVFGIGGPNVVGAIGGSIGNTALSASVQSTMASALGSELAPALAAGSGPALAGPAGAAAVTGATGGAAGGAGAAAGGVATPTAASQGFFGSTIGLLTNPWTIAAGLGVLGATIWLKSQAHHEANTIVKNIEEPFWKAWGGILPTDDPTALAQLPAAEARAMGDALTTMNANYKGLVSKFREGGSDERLVSDQSLNNTQPHVTRILTALRQAVLAGGAPDPGWDVDGGLV